MAVKERIKSWLALNAFGLALHKLYLKIKYRSFLELKRKCLILSST